MGWKRARRARFGAFASRFAWALAMIAVGASASVEADARAGAVEYGPKPPPGDATHTAVTGAPPAPLPLEPRRQLDERFRRIGPVDGPRPVLRERGHGLVHRDPEGRFLATVNPDGRVAFRDRGISFRNQRVMGLYDVVLAAQGIERHQTAKRAFLRETFADRLAMREGWTMGNLEDAERGLWGELHQIWANERLTREERKQMILQRWEECDVHVDLEPATGGVSVVDRQRRRVARRARRAIEHFVRLYVDEHSSFRRDEDPGHDVAISLAPDLFEECERDAKKCIRVGDLLVGRRANAFDADRGARYYARACDAGDPWSCYELAVLHYLGLGAARNDRRAAELHGLACEAGIAGGCAYLVHLHRKGIGVPRSEADARHYRQLACEKGLDDYCEGSSPRPRRVP